MIVGFNVDSLEASKEGSAQGNVQINYNPQIDNVEATEVNAFDEEVAKVDFTFIVSYEAGGTEGAQIKMAGDLLWKGNLEEMLEAWEEEQDLPEEVAPPLMNELYRKLISEAVGVADTLNLLPPVPTPQVERQQ
ncbi:MAG: hypothetical protein ABEK01_04710 [Candidatus Nanohaloarchaea archaeon]